MTDRHYAGWTTGEKRRLLKMRADRVPVKIIARELGRTPDAIHSFLRYVPTSAKRRPPKPIYSPSDALRDATLRAFLMAAVRARVDVDTAARKLLSEGERV